MASCFLCYSKMYIWITIYFFKKSFIWNWNFLLGNFKCTQIIHQHIEPVVSIILLYIHACKTDYRFSNIYQKSSLKRIICSQYKDKLLCSFPYMYRVGYFTCTIIRQFYLSLMIWSCSDETVELSTFGSSPVGFVVSSSNRQAKKWQTGSRSCWPGSQLWWWCHGHASLYAGNGPGKHPQVLKTHHIILP